jgi:hypothetical protein
LEIAKISNFLQTVKKQGSSLPLMDLKEHLDMMIAALKITSPVMGLDKLPVGPKSHITHELAKLLLSFILTCPKAQILTGLKDLAIQLVKGQIAVSAQKKSASSDTIANQLLIQLVAIVYQNSLYEKSDICVAEALFDAFKGQLNNPAVSNSIIWIMDQQSLTVGSIKVTHPCAIQCIERLNDRLV